MCELSNRSLGTILYVDLPRHFCSKVMLTSFLASSSRNRSILINQSHWYSASNMQSHWLFWRPAPWRGQCFISDILVIEWDTWTLHAFVLSQSAFDTCSSHYLFYYALSSPSAQTLLYIFVGRQPSAVLAFSIAPFTERFDAFIVIFVKEEYWSSS